MRVLHLIAPGGVGGAETVVAAGTAALRAAGADATVGIIDEARAPDAAEAFRARLDEACVPYVSFRARRRLDPVLALQLRKELVASRFDAIHAHGYKAVIYASMASRNAPPLFATQHGEGGGGRRVGLYVTLAYRAYHRFTRVFAVSEATRAHLVKRGVAPDRTATLHNFISLRDTAIPRAPTAGPTRLVYVGRLSREKGVDVLLQALAWSSSEATLTLVGDGDQRRALERQVLNLGLEDRVLFVGFQSDIAPWVHEAHCAVLPSRTEGLPMTMLEAAALGRPVIATLVGGVPEVLQFTPGAAAVRSEDAAAFAGALDGFESEREDRIRAAIAAAPDVRARFSANSWAERTLEAYRG